MGSSRDRRRKQKRAEARKSSQNWERWAEKTSALLMTEDDFCQRKRAESWFVLGVMGFAGSWRRSGRTGDDLQRYQAEMKASIGAVLRELRGDHGERLVVSSGATNLGVLQITYELCTEEEILALGVTPHQTLNYDIGRLDMLIPYGRRYGDESQVFLNTSDAFLLVGGGPQSKREAEAAQARGKPITIIQGFGGVADQLSPKEWPDALFLQREAP